MYDVSILRLEAFEFGGLIQNLGTFMVMGSISLLGTFNMHGSICFNVTSAFVVHSAILLLSEMVDQS
jgi:hypothetical protein